MRMFIVGRAGYVFSIAYKVLDSEWFVVKRSVRKNERDQHITFFCRSPNQAQPHRGTKLKNTNVIAMQSLFILLFIE